MASSSSCAMPDRVDLRVAGGSSACNDTTTREGCEASYASGWPAGNFPNGFVRPCVWSGSDCASGDRARCSSLREWHQCPSLDQTWQSLPGHPSSTARWMCRGDGTWQPLGAPNAADRSGGPSRAAAWSMSAQQCTSFPWRANDPGWRPRAEQPAVFGLDDDVRRHVLGRRWDNATVLAMEMTVNSDASPVHWTPCANLAFAMCALRGHLANRVPGTTAAARLFLATRGSDVVRRCRPDVVVSQLLNRTRHERCAGSACRAYDASWDECYVTKSEYCTIAGACVNGDEVWNTTGPWVCRLRPEAMLRSTDGRVSAY